jgi:hypothetical protein
MPKLDDDNGDAVCHKSSVCNTQVENFLHRAFFKRKNSPRPQENGWLPLIPPCILCTTGEFHLESNERKEQQNGKSQMECIELSTVADVQVTSTTAYVQVGRSADDENMGKKTAFPSFLKRKTSIRRFGVRTPGGKPCNGAERAFWKIVE